MVKDNEAEVTQKPPKYSNTKKQAMGKDTKLEEKKSWKTPLKSDTLKMSKKPNSFSASNQSKPHKSMETNKFWKPQVSEEENKSPFKLNQSWMSSQQNSKHSNNINKKPPKAENTNCGNSAQTSWNSIAKEGMKAVNSNSNSMRVGHANPQCDYNPPTPEMAQVQYQDAYQYAQAQQYMYENILYQAVSKQIDEETESITIMVNMIQKYRQSIKSELEKVAIKAFEDYHKNVQAHIYGSVATELALPESDMDIMITGINSFGNKDSHLSNISMLFDNVQASFDSKLMVKSQKILQTQVPIIKLTFNLSKYFDEYTKDGQYSLPFINFESIDSINPHLKNLSVDISISDSFDDSAHHGLLQNNFIKEKLALHPELRPVCLVLKKLLVENHFNDPYTGGLGSFSLFLMLYAALRFEQLHTEQLFLTEHTIKARLFAWFLTLYGENFDIETKTIFFLQDGTPMVFDKFGKSKGVNNSMLWVYDPTNSKNNTTQKAFRIKDIQKLFKEKKQSITSNFSKIYNKDTKYSKIF